MKGAHICLAVLGILAPIQGANMRSRNELKSMLEQISSKCLKDTNVPEDSYKAFVSSIIPEDESMQCYFECLYKAMGLITEGKFNKENAKHLANARYKDSHELKRTEELFKDCEKVEPVPDIKCGLGLAVRQCIVEYGRKTNFYASP